MHLLDVPPREARLQGRPSGVIAALLGRIFPDDRRIRRAYAQWLAQGAERPDFTVVRGPVPAFLAIPRPR